MIPLKAIRGKTRLWHQDTLRETAFPNGLLHLVGHQQHWAERSWKSNIIGNVSTMGSRHPCLTNMRPVQEQKHRGKRDHTRRHFQNLDTFGTWLFPSPISNEHERPRDAQISQLNNTGKNMALPVPSSFYMLGNPHPKLWKTFFRV